MFFHPGVATAVGLFALIWFIIYFKSKGKPVVFDPGGKHGEFGKSCFPCTWILRNSSWDHLYHPSDPRSYTLFQYTRNQSLGFGALVCFCISYIWLIAAATK